jgi:cytochrome bd-type quinol oxidase subunit 2
MLKRHRRVVAVVLGVVATWLLVGAAMELADAARGATGDTAREVPLLFGLVGVFVAAAVGIAAMRVWRSAGKAEPRP